MAARRAARAMGFLNSVFKEARERPAVDKWPRVGRQLSCKRIDGIGRIWMSLKRNGNSFLMPLIFHFMFWRIVLSLVAPSPAEIQRSEMLERFIAIQRTRKS